MTRSGSVSAFPRYRERRLPRRTLAVRQLGRLVTEEGELVATPDWPATRRAMVERDLLVLSPPLAGAHDLAALLADDCTSVLLTQADRVALVLVTDERDRRIRRALVPWTSWGEGLIPEPEDLALLRATFDHCGVGDRATPSALGCALLREQYPREAPLLSRPSRWQWQRLHDGLVGGRVDTIAPGIEFERAWGEDMVGAYVAAARQIPQGTARHFRGTPPSSLATYFQHCRVAVAPYALGPLPQRTPERVLYPVDSVIEGWWWREELAQMPVRVLWRGEGYGYPALSEALAPWAERMYGLRLTAPTAAVAALVKRASVAAIGRLGTGWERKRLLPWPGKGELWCSFELGPATPSALVLREQRESELMAIQAASYINMQVRCALYARAYAYAVRCTLIATNYDELLVAERPPAPEPAALGAWRVTEYERLLVPYARAKLARGYDIRPGIPKVLRAG